MPHIEDPAKVIDLYSYALAFQTHATLFRFDKTYLPTPYLVSNFQVLPNQKLYVFTLKEVSFHNKKPLTAQNVIESLEHVVRFQATNHEALKAVKGFEAFQKKKANHISGLKVLSDPKNLKFSIELISPDSELLQKLTDLNLAIWDVKSGYKIGAGPYQLESQTKDKIVLTRASQAAFQDAELGPSKVIITALTTSDAFKAFEKKEIDDLFFYSIPEHETEKLKSYAHIQKVLFPRTYYLALNARRLTSLKERKSLFDAVSVPGIVQTCFPANQPTRNLIPPGFIGHEEESSFPALTAKPLEKIAAARPIRIMIAESLGQETCLLNFLNKSFEGRAKVNITINPITEITKNWRDSAIDGYLAFMEGETTLHYFGVFSPESNFPLGLPKDSVFTELYSKFLGEEDPKNKQSTAVTLAHHILSQATLLPLFHPNVYLVYQNKFQPLPTPFLSAALLPLTELNLKKEGMPK
jgi:ABC-type transport system substrate-binding protein